MPNVEIPVDQIQWPPKCCRCGSTEYVYRAHTDDVVTRTLLSVTEYRKISLQIPVCNRCARAQWVWFGAAIGLAAVGMLILYVAGESDTVGNIIAVVFILAVLAAIVGVRQRPIKILKYDDKKHTLNIRIYNDDVARAVSSGNNEGQARAAAPR
jgi:hypothetical protein